MRTLLILSMAVSCLLAMPVQPEADLLLAELSGSASGSGADYDDALTSSGSGSGDFSGSGDSEVPLLAPVVLTGNLVLDNCATFSRIATGKPVHLADVVSVYTAIREKTLTLTHAEFEAELRSVISSEHVARAAANGVDLKTTLSRVMAIFDKIQSGGGRDVAALIARAQHRQLDVNGPVELENGVPVKVVVVKLGIMNLPDINVVMPSHHFEHPDGVSVEHKPTEVGKESLDNQVERKVEDNHDEDNTDKEDNDNNDEDEDKEDEDKKAEEAEEAEEDEQNNDEDEDEDNE